ncbi:MAG: cupin domain-containing protein [Saprospiraceae bacterium]|nr:cupin domain-containing protein [Lewinella sp.]
MSHFKQTDHIESKELFPGFHARMIHTDGLTIVYFDIKAGSILPEHHHIHEQVTNVLEGTLELTVDGETFACTPGTVVTMPPHAPHSGRALTDCKVIDVFRPVREDYK